MNVTDNINTLANDFSSMAANLKAHTDKLVAYGRGLEAIIADRTAQLAHEKDNLEMSVAERTAQLNAANAVLTKQATRLIQRNQEITLFSKMNDFLQASTTEAQAYSVISGTISQLFPGDSGAIFLLSPTRDSLEAAAVWGATPPTAPAFKPEECWAHRRGQAHLVVSRDLRCAHVADEDQMYFCLPLLAQGETLGVLHLANGPVTNDPADEERMSEKCALAKILADNIGLGIANLKLREAMRSLSIRDPLTGLFNRRYMEEVLGQELHRTRRNDVRLAIIMLDIDHFKRFNDDSGHDAGDAVLRELGTLLTSHVRGSDVACRFGGEEFVLILSPSTIDGATQRAETIRQAAERLSVRHGGRSLGKITLSLGVAIFPDDASDVDATLKAADIALYQAKEAGRNCVVVARADPEMISAQAPASVHAKKRAKVPARPAKA